MKMQSDLTIKCRGCLHEEPEMHNLFRLQTNDLTLANILSETTSIQVYESEETSPYLCMKCTQIVIDFYNFKLQFTKSEMYIQNELEKFRGDSLESLTAALPEKIIFVEDNDVFEDHKGVKQELLEQINSEETLGAENKVHPNKSLPPLSPIVKNKTNEQIVSYDLSTEINKQVSPEVGEFTVQNELVQLIESVVFCCESCSQEYLLEDHFLGHMYSEHGKTKIDANKFTKKTLVKFPLAKVKVENDDIDLELDKDDIKDEKLCKFCNILVSKTEYEVHHDEHKTHICNCGAKFLRKSQLVNHEMSVHSEERHFICKYCSKAFKTRQTLTKHMRYHTHPRSEICHICGHKFNDKSVLNTHIKLIHFPTREFQCSHCGLNFSLKSTLFKHTRRHHTSNRERAFTCPECNVMYFDKSTLNRHMSVKHSNQPVKAKCEYCGKTFTTKGNLYKHLRTTHKYDSIVISSDGSILVQKGAKLAKAGLFPGPVSSATNSVLERRTLFS